ncbi:helix-turn-helix domain-containing protein [Streptomyces sp. NBC_01218]|nr:MULTISPECIES: helix-turn-helix domain-containing protein [unclassified Streptomyces]WEH41319.1 helix-turn-helix domain-containing protein [Streptomyces sp. AM 2-1-1]WSQ52948.1 helix-turn-helix domain-containing protein [Streptomyces sp. NBC_01218]
MIETVFRSEDLPPDDRLEWWRELTSQALSPTVIVPDRADDFRAGLRLLSLGATQVATLSYPALRSRRTPAMIRRSDPEQYHLCLALKGGQSICHGGRDTAMRAGDLLLYDSSRPSDARVFPPPGEAVEGIIVSVPRAVFPLPPAKVDRLLATRLPGDRGTGALLSHFLTRMTAECAALGPHDAVRLDAVTLDLVTAFLGQHLDATDAVPAEHRQGALLVGIHSFIERNLGDPQLSPALIAAAHHISVRYLHLLFQQRGGSTVSTWIRRSRLERCRRDLRDPLLRHLPLRSIAARWGFQHPAEFSRVFRAVHGMPPRDYRQQAQHSA